MRTRVLVVTILIAVTPVESRELHVWPDGSGAFPTIQAAVDSAVSGDTVILRVEKPPFRFLGPGNRDVLVQDRAITVRGGRIDCEAGPGDPHRAFVILGQQSSGTILENMQVKNGWAAGTLGDAGGLVYCGEDVSVLFRRVSFQTSFADKGGALFSRGTTLTLEDCSFFANFGTDAGAIYMEGPQGHLSITRCSLYANSTLMGSVVHVAGTDCEIRNCVFSYNTAPHSVGLSGGSRVQCFNSILMGGSTADGTFFCQGEGVVEVECSDIFNGFDSNSCWLWDPARHNLSVDPQFCIVSPYQFWVGTDWFLQSDSPCRAAVNGCGVMGINDVGCGTTLVTSTTWGSIKALHR